MGKKFKVTLFIEIENLKEFRRFLKQEEYDWESFFSDYGIFSEGTILGLYADYGENNIDFEFRDIVGSIKVEEIKSKLNKQKENIKEK